MLVCSIAKALSYPTKETAMFGDAVLGVPPTGVWLAAICAEAKPTITKVKATTATNPITIFVLFILFITILPYVHGCLWQLAETVDETD